MSFRSRVAALVALTVALAFLLASAVAFGSSRRSLLGAVDAQLIEAVSGGQAPGTAPPALIELRDLLGQDRGSLGPGVRDRRRGPTGPAGDALRGVGVLQVIGADGQVVRTQPTDIEPLPTPTSGVDALGPGERTAIETVVADGTPYRTVAAGVGGGFIIQIARPIGDIQDGLARMAWTLALASAVGVGLAFVAGRVVADRVLRPVRQLTTTAELIAETQDLAHRAEVEGDDELARLGGSLNRMLVALDASRRAQERLVADASHELRTPLTSLRTNIEVLSAGEALGETDRASIRRDVVGQIEEMTVLIGNLVDLARDGAEPTRVDAVALDEVVADVVDRQRRLHPEVDLTLTAEAATVHGDRDRLERAVTNLIDNAVKYAGHHGPIEVTVSSGLVRVRDHGPGIAEADRAHVFDRFWRAATARGAPGSGLGLAIVAQVAASHGGEAAVTDAPGGGAAFELRLPPASS